jgi:hypothetical protein
MMPVTQTIKICLKLEEVHSLDGATELEDINRSNAASQSARPERSQTVCSDSSSDQRVRP